MASIVQKPSDLDFPESSQDIPQTKKSFKKSPQTKISVCDVMKNNTSSIIKKINGKGLIFKNYNSIFVTLVLKSDSYHVVFASVLIEAFALIAIWENTRFLSIEP